MVAFFDKLAPTVIAIEACGASHHWARLLQSFGHSVKLIPPQLVKPYVKRGKNDAADAEALCEAMSRPTMRFVPVKTVEQQAALMLVGVRDRLIRNRTQLANTIRGYAAEFGLTAAKGMCKIEPLLARIAADETLPELARELFALESLGFAQNFLSSCELEALHFIGILSSRENPKICGIDDAKVVCDLVAVDRPVPRHLLAQKSQYRTSEILEPSVAFVMGAVPVHQSPQSFDRIQMWAV